MNTNKEAMPHNGFLLKKYINDSGQTITALAKEMDSSISVVLRQYKTYSLRTHVWWKLGLALNRNIFAELAEYFPIKYKTRREQELEVELEDIRKELEIYKRIIDK